MVATSLFGPRTESRVPQLATTGTAVTVTGEEQAPGRDGTDAELFAVDWAIVPGDVDSGPELGRGE